MPKVQCLAIVYEVVYEVAAIMLESIRLSVLCVMWWLIGSHKSHQSTFAKESVGITDMLL